jgi:hypothetical protein
MARLLLQPLIAQIGLVAVLYAWLTLLRTRAVARGEVAYDAFVLGREEPRRIARVTRNLANQFELPTLFAACVALLVALDAATLVDVVLGWVFVAGRVAHAVVQTLTDDVPLRGRVFTINFVAFLGIAAHLALIAIGLA